MAQNDCEQAPDYEAQEAIKSLALSMAELTGQVSEISQGTKFIRTIVNSLAQDVQGVKEDIQEIKKGLPKNGKTEE